MMRLYSGCGTRRPTSTTMVFCILVDTTSPIFSFLCAWVACCSAMLFTRSGKFPFAQHRENAGAGLLHRPDLLQAFHLSHRHLELQPEHLLIHILELPLEFRCVEIANFLRLHILYSASFRLTNLVLIG